ncbi:hypothetical protein [Evansella tamaricis]|uniref:Uncharacterized protein n=1 Tax=Evansella tamaricis TaxID=2069301 RepID=A0ABS6JDW3_9BACI|nr:hypothetical protein [Evansella tamaricis]MBU9710528.1 hypothetical protein [Evansella tamaricis]
MLHCLADWKINNTTKDLPVYLYEMKLNNVEQRHQQNYAVTSELAKLNNWQIIVYHDRYIASMDEIKNWGEHVYTTSHNRCINNDTTHERKVLERLLLRHVEKSSYARKNYDVLNGSFWDRGTCTVA